MAKGSGSAIKNASTIVVEKYCPACERSYPEALEVCPDDGHRLVRLTQQEVALVGTTFDGRFEIHNLLGDGGMGAVFRATEIETGRELAVKLIRQELTNDIKVAKRFMREAKVSSGVKHPNTVEVYDYGQTEDGVLYLTMELLKGETLEDCLIKHGRMPPALVGAIVSQILDALSVAHAKGVIHRDLKPSNVMVQTVDGKPAVKVLDFGLAKSLGSDNATTAGFLMGTPAYLAPEIILRGDINYASDLYAVGVLMYEVLAGDVPFTDEEIPSVLMAHAHRPVPHLPPDIPDGIAEFVYQLLAKKPAERFASAKAAQKALHSAVADLTNLTELDIAQTTEMAKLEAPDELWADEDEDAGTVRREPLPANTADWPAQPGPGAEAQGKGRPRRGFIPVNTKMLHAVPPLREMQDEILEAVSDDESITREMVALLERDTDQMEAPEDDAPTEHHVIPPSLMVAGAADTDEMDAHGGVGLSQPRLELATTKMPKQDQQALLAELAQDDGLGDGEYSTALVDRDAVRQVRMRVAQPNGISGPLFWAFFALLGVGAGVIVWYLIL